MSMSRTGGCPTDSPLHPSLEESAAWAGHWHAAQRDKAGQPYVGHLVRVSRHLVRLFPDASAVERHAAWLHDLLEDTEVTAAELAARGYAPEVIATVQAVTKSPDPELTYAQRIDHLARAGTVSAIRVKLADLSDNSDPDRLAQLPKDKAASLGARYRAAKQRLFEELDRRSGDQGADGSNHPS
ncbi:HD domain-containing protein [Mameliella sp.]|uniref:HD domain-containing protein n=1 Tax=Mameliella sp. TaxID=1924940 RepID=UPI003B50933B